MKWRNCKEKEVHNARSPMDELMAQGLAQEEEEPARNRADAKTKRLPTSQKSVKDTWKGRNGGAANPCENCIEAAALVWNLTTNTEDINFSLHVG